MDRFHADTIRIFLGGKYDYLHPELSPSRATGVPLVRIVALPRYRAVLDNPRIHTVWLTVYPVFGGGEIDLRGHVPDSAWLSESAQMRDLVEWLYRRYGDQDRVILISNNEADEKLREVHSPENVARDLDLRMRAVEEVRSRHPNAQLKVFCGVEVKLWRLKLDGAPNALESIVPRLRYDFISYTTWELVSHPELLPEALSDIAARTRPTPEGRAYFGEHHVLIGEFGWAREWKVPAEPLLKASLDLLKSGRTPYAIYWQVYDNARGDARGFGLLDLHDGLTLQGNLLLKLWYHQ